MDLELKVKKVIKREAESTNWLIEQQAIIGICKGMGFIKDVVGDMAVAAFGCCSCAWPGLGAAETIGQKRVSGGSRQRKEAFPFHPLYSSSFLRPQSNRLGTFADEEAPE